MTRYSKVNSPKSITYSAVHAWLMNFFCLTLLIFALAAATRLPHYAAEGDYVRLVGVGLFMLLAFLGLADNIYMHYRVLQAQNKPSLDQAEMAA